MITRNKLLENVLLGILKCIIIFRTPSKSANNMLCRQTNQFQVINGIVKRNQTDIVFHECHVTFVVKNKDHFFLLRNYSNNY